MSLFHATPAEAQDPTAPGVPRNVQVTPGDASLTITWDAPSSWGDWTASFFEVEWKAGGLTAVLGQVREYGPPLFESASFVDPGDHLSPTDTSYVFTGIQQASMPVVEYPVRNGLIYELRIRAVSLNPDTDGSRSSHYLNGNWVRLSGTPGAVAAPGGLTVTPGNAKLDLTWTASAGATGYDVHYTSGDPSPFTTGTGSDPAAAWFPVTRSGTTASQTISSLANGTEYNVRVRATNADGGGAWTFSAGKPGGLAAPAGLTVTPGDAKLGLTWTASAGATGYDVHYTSAQTPGAGAAASGSDPSTAWVAVTRSGTTASQTISSLSNTTFYQVRVRTKTSSASSAWVFGGGKPDGPVWQATITPVAFSQSGLAGFGCLDRTECDSQISPSNSFRFGDTDYHFRVAVDVDTGSPNLFQASLNTAPNRRLRVYKFCVGTQEYSFEDDFFDALVFGQSDPGWAVGTPVQLKIASACAAQTTTPTPSSDATLTALTASTSTSASGTFTALDIGAFAAATTEYTASVANSITHAKLAWTVSDSGASVKVGKGTSLAAVTSGSASGAIELGVGANALKVEVTAADGSTMKEYTVTVTRAAAQQTTAPAAPTDLTVLSDYKRLDVSWTAPPGTVTGYDVHYASKPVTAWVPVTRTETSPPTASQTISSLTNGTTYRVRVRAKTSANVGAWAYGSGTPAALGRPLNLSVEPGDKRLRLVWDRNYGGGTPASYAVHYTSSPTVAADAAVGTDAATAWVDTGYGGRLSQYTIAGLTNGTTYRVRVSARHMDDGSPYAEGSGTPSRTIVTPRRPVTVSISARPNPVAEGSSVTVTATLSRALTQAVTIPLTLTAGTAETGDHGALASVTINAGATTGTGTIAASQDADTDDETFTVALGSLPSAVTAGSPASVQVTIADDDTDGGGPPTGGPGGPPPPPDDEEDDENDGDDGGPPPGGPPPGSGGGPPRAVMETDAECEAGLCRARTGEPVSFRDAGSGTVRSRLWDFGDGRTSPSASPARAWARPGFYTVTLLVSDESVESTDSLTFLVEAAAPAGTCVADDETRCLADSRFAVEAEWSTGGGESGPAKVAREGTNESGMFWFFGENNWEVLIKVLDGCAANGHAWVFGASTTDLGYVIRVSDTATGTTKEYRNEPGTPAPAITDVKAFPDACQAN